MGGSFTGCWPHFVCVRCGLACSIPRFDIRNAIHITFARRGGWLPRELDAPPRTFFHSERPRHSRRLRPGQLSWCCSVYRDRVPRAMRGPGVRARSGARCAARPTVRGASARVYSRHTASQNFSRVPPAPPVRRPARNGTRRRGAGRARPLALQATRPKGERQTRFTGASPSLRPLVAA